MKSMNVLALLTLFSLVACGGGSGGSGSGGKRNVASEMVEATPGTYYAVLRPVNFHSNGFLPYGQAMISLRDDLLQVSTSMDDDQPVNHRQTVHAGSRCPSASDDLNGDSFIDYNEAMAVVGKAILPLDGDLNSQAAGAEVYPRGIGMTYNRSASLAKVNADLGLGIGFDGRVVLIHGTAINSAIPTSVASYQTEPANISLPVVCGILKKID
jgi:hypothetical protein